MSQGGTPVSQPLLEPGLPSAMDEVLKELLRNGGTFSGRERNRCFLNLAGEGFADISAISNLDFPDDARAVARTDWDADGDLDFWFGNRSAPQVRFSRNTMPPDARHFIAVRLEGNGATVSRDAVGARVEIAPPGAEGHPISRELAAGEGFLSQSSKWLHFGLGREAAVSALHVYWPDGTHDEFTDIPADRHYLIQQGRKSALPWRAPTSAAGPFTAPPNQPSGSASRFYSASGLLLPPLRYEDGSGEQVGVHEARGDGSRAQLLLLWASWCAPCLHELREIAREAEAIKAAGIDVLALSVDGLGESSPTTRDDARRALREIGFPFDSGYAQESALEIVQLVFDQFFDLRRPIAVPTAILLDANRRVCAIYSGGFDSPMLLADVASLGESQRIREQLASPLPGNWFERRPRGSPFGLAWQLIENGHYDEGLEYIRKQQSLFTALGARRSTALRTSFPRLLLVAGNRLAGDRPQLAADYFRAALKIEPASAGATNNLCWLLATHPDDTARDGAEALRLSALLSQRANVEPNNHRWSDTLAAVYAENGDFERAVEFGERAVSAAKGTAEEEAMRIAQRLELYRASRPYRETRQHALD